MLEAWLVMHSNYTLSGISGICQLLCGTVQSRLRVWGFTPPTLQGSRGLELPAVGSRLSPEECSGYSTVGRCTLKKVAPHAPGKS